MEIPLQEVASKLTLELFDICLTVEHDDDDSEDHSLIELAGEVLGVSLGTDIK